MKNRGAHHALKDLAVKDGVVLLTVDGEGGDQILEVPLSEVARLIGVMSGDDFHQLVLDFLILDLGPQVGLIPLEAGWGDKLIAADERFLERTGRIFQGYCGGVPHHWRSGFGLGITVKPSLHPRHEMEELLQEEGGLLIEETPKNFTELKWNP